LRNANPLYRHSPPPHHREGHDRLFKVKVTGVRTSTVEGKERRRGKFAGYRPDWKKAYVRLKDGEKMPEYLNSL
jgi:large subunit ribosomal protein L23